jgi:hypothetical protein
MKYILLAAMTVLPLLGAHAANEAETWVAAGFAGAEIKTVVLALQQQPGMTHYLDATLVMYRDIGWSETELTERARKTALIYRQCQVQFRSFKLVSVQAPFGTPDCGWTDGGDERVTRATPPTVHPVAYFARHNRDGNYAYAWRKSNTAVESLTNTAWFTRSIDEDSDYLAEILDPRYEVLAHEFGHLLIDSGHVTDGTHNLMAEEGQLISAELTPAQCERIRNHEWVRAF